MQVWRPVPGSATSTRARFELVGHTSIKYKTKGTYDVATVDRIQVLIFTRMGKTLKTPFSFLA